MTDMLDPQLDNYKVKLISIASLRFDDPSRVERVIFNITPTFSETRSVDYAQVAPVHMPGGIQVYKKTNAREFSLTAHFISRNMDDATDNMYYLQTLRGWTMPYFGARSATGDGQRQQHERDKSSIEAATSTSDAGDNQQVGNDEDVVDTIKRRLQADINLIGAPPDVLYLYAYSRQGSRDGGLVNINRVPVVLSSLSISYPEDVDYIPTRFGNRDPMPVKMDVQITLLETHSPREYEQFSLSDFKSGKLVNF